MTDKINKYYLDTVLTVGEKQPRNNEKFFDVFSNQLFVYFHNWIKYI